MQPRTGVCFSVIMRGFNREVMLSRRPLAVSSNLCPQEA